MAEPEIKGHKRKQDNDDKHFDVHAKMLPNQSNGIKRGAWRTTNRPEALNRQ